MLLIVKSSLFERIKERGDSLSPKQAQLAKYLINNYKTAAFQTIAQIARESNVSEATVVRLAMFLGYSGFPEMLDDLQAVVRHELQAFETIRRTYRGDQLKKHNILFTMLSGCPETEVPNYCKLINAGALISDFSPLQINLKWKMNLAARLDLAHIEVDAHNIVPCRLASGKQEYAAYTLRPKLNKLLPEFLTEFPNLIKHPFTMDEIFKKITFAQAMKSIKAVDLQSVKYEHQPGEKAAFRMMQHFIENKLQGYESDRNNPTKEGQSNLSPYLHFGQLSAQQLALLVSKADAPGVRGEAFLEELIVRRELSDNYCFYQPKYDSIKAFPRWAIKSLEEHLADRRDHIYTTELFENAETHDGLWNAAQKEMVCRGKMHGYLRMYWAKKILEWTDSPAEAMHIAIYLNDKYSLDGRDPNGYAGIAWSIGGVHDRAWFQRPIFGKVRYMSYKGSQSKFDVTAYINKIAALEGRQ